MKCQNCGENEANVRYTQIINGVKKQMNLCDKCANELGIEDINFSMPIDFSSFLGDMIDMYDDPIPTMLKEENLICDKCKMTYDDFLNTGKFGCDNCYETFGIKLNPILKNIHGSNTHVGRIGKYLSEKNEIKNDEKIIKKDIKKENNTNEKNKENIEQNSKLEELQLRLKQEIKEERYEDAAKTRDEIKKMNKDK